MESFTNVAALLEVEESCAKESEKVFAALGPNALQCANAGLRVFAAAAKWVRKWQEDQSFNEAFNTTAEELGSAANNYWSSLALGQKHPAKTYSS